MYLGAGCVYDSAVLEKSNRISHGSSKCVRKLISAAKCCMGKEIFSWINMGACMEVVAFLASTNYAQVHCGTSSESKQCNSKKRKPLYSHFLSKILFHILWYMQNGLKVPILFKMSYVWLAWITIFSKKIHETTRLCQ